MRNTLIKIILFTLLLSFFKANSSFAACTGGEWIKVYESTCGRNASGVATCSNSSYDQWAKCSDVQGYGCVHRVSYGSTCELSGTYPYACIQGAFNVANDYYYTKLGCRNCVSELYLDSLALNLTPAIYKAGSNITAKAYVDNQGCEEGTASVSFYKNSSYQGSGSVTVPADTYSGYYASKTFNAGSNAGSYTATATYGGVSRSANYTVNAKISGKVCESTDADCSDSADVQIKDSGIAFQLFKDSLKINDANNGSNGYTFGYKGAGNYQVKMLSNSKYFPVSPQTQNLVLGPDTTRDFTVCSYAIAGQVYIDTNRDGIKQSTEITGYKNAKITIKSGTTTLGSVYTDANGKFTSNDLTTPLQAGSTYTATIDSPTTANGYRTYTASTQTVAITTAKCGWEVNFGINRVYTVSGRYYADADKNSSYNANYDKGLRDIQITLVGTETTGVTIPATTTSTATDGSYSFTNIAPGTYTVSGPATSDDYTYLSPQSVPITITAANGVVNFRVFGKYSISGSVFIDNNPQNKVKDTNENNYQANPLIRVSTTSTAAPLPYVRNYTNGTYVASGLISNATYTIDYTGLPIGYTINYPINDPPPSYDVRIYNSSTACASVSPNGGTCSSGNITNLNFALLQPGAWVQSFGLDLRVDKGYNNPIPTTTACGPYAMLPFTSGSPGILFTGEDAVSDLNNDVSARGYKVGTSNWPEKFNTSLLRTSYAYFQQVIDQLDITPKTLSDYCVNNTLSSCTLTSPFYSGYYQANGNVTLNGFKFTGNRDIIFLINGNLTLNGKIQVASPSTTVTFIASGNIIVNNTVGSAYDPAYTPQSDYCKPPAASFGDIEGFYSTDRNFQVKGDPNTPCPAIDLRLHIQGSIVVNAANKGGAFTNDRTLCNNTVPVITFKERPDMILSSPGFIKNSSYIYKEEAP